MCEYKALIEIGRKLSNGTPVVFESLVLDEREDEGEVLAAITANVPQEDIKLKFPPQYVVVSVPDGNSEDFIGCTMVPGKVAIPVPRKRIPEPVDFPFPGFRKPRRLHYRPHGGELRFASTVHKVQGGNCNKISLQLNKRPFTPNINFFSLLVALSRVTKSENIRLMPLHPGENSNLSYLANLVPPEDLLKWESFFEEDKATGISFWNIEKARASYLNQRKPNRTDEKRGILK